MAQLMQTKVILTLLLSCLVFVAHKHAMVQVHSWVRGHGDKAPRLPQQEAAPEVNACPCHHALIAVCMFAGLISSSSAWLPSRDWCLERATRDHRRSPMSPPDASIVVALAYYATHDSALHRNWSTGGTVHVRSMAIVSSPRAALEGPKGPSRGHEDGRAATCDGASGRLC